MISTYMIRYEIQHSLAVIHHVPCSSCNAETVLGCERTSLFFTHTAVGALLMAALGVLHFQHASCVSVGTTGRRFGTHCGPT